MKWFEIRWALGAFLVFGGTLFTVSPSADGNGNVYVSRFWHNHQPTYWPDWNTNGGETERVQYAWDSIVLKPGQNFGGLSSKQHPENNLTDIFGLDDRRNAYQGRPRDSLSTFNSAGGFAVSYSGSLIDNVRQLGAVNQLGYGGGWWDGNRQARNWFTPSGGRRLDLVGFTYHHSLAPLLPKEVFRKELQIFKQGYWKAWNGNSDLSDHSKGFFPTEMGFSSHLIDVLVDEGYEWSIVASHHLSRTCPTYLDNADPESSYNIFSSPPNRADRLGPSPTSGWWYSEPNPGNAAWNVSPFAYQLHKAKYVNPDTGAEKTMFLVPSDDVLSYRYGYANEGIGKISGSISPHANDPNKPVIVMPSTDGDNAWGGGFSSWMEATPQLFNESQGAGYNITTPQDFVNAFGGNADTVHIEDGAWIFPTDDYGSPYFLKWIEPPLYNGTTATNRYPNTKADLETPGFALKFFSYAPLMAGANWCITAEQILKDQGGSVNAWKIQAPYDWNGSWTSPNEVELAWHIYLAGLDSGFNYYGGLGNDDEVKPALATKNAIDKLQSFMSTRMNLDQTPPTVLKPQRFPYNPGWYTFGWFNSYGSGTNAAYKKKMPSEFYVWTHAYDVNGITNVSLKVRVDNDGVNTMANNQNETYAGGGDVGSWISVPMAKRVLPKTRSELNSIADNGEIDYVVFDPSYWSDPQIADYYFAKITDSSVPNFRGKLLDYYVEAADSLGNLHKSEIQHVFVENDGQSGEIGSAVSFSSDPRDCDPLTVTYTANDGVLSNTTPVSMQISFDNGSNWNLYVMSDLGGGTSAYTVATVPDNAPSAIVWFQNGAGSIIDSNGGQNWSTPIRDCEAPVGPSVAVFSNAPACSPVTIDYIPNAGPLLGAGQVYMHLGYDDWGQVFPSQMMTQVTNNLWRITVLPPEGVSEINFVFNDGTDWDNNGGLDWTFSLNACEPPPVPAGIVITNPPGDITVGNEVTTYSLKGTVGDGVVGIVTWTNGLNAADGQFSSEDTEWNVAAVPLAVGANVITVTGTNTGDQVITNAADHAGEAAYSDGWTDTDDGGFGFGSWELYVSSGVGNENGLFIEHTAASVNIGKPAWGLYANSGNLAEAKRVLTNAMLVGQTLKVKLDHGFIDSGSGVGVALQNDASDTLWQFFFNGGDQNYNITGSSSDIGWTPGGLNIEITLTGPTSYVSRITPLGGETRTNTGNFASTSNSTDVTRFRCWNFNAGSGSDYDVFFNDLMLITTASGPGVSTGDTVTITREGGVIDTDSDGIPDSWELLHYGDATGAVAGADTDGDGLTALEEFIADTIPTNSMSSITNLILEAQTGPGVMYLDIPGPTTNSRMYDAWISTNLVDGTWERTNLDMPGAPNGANVTLTDTNQGGKLFYRTGVRIP